MSLSKLLAAVREVGFAQGLQLACSDLSGDLESVLGAKRHPDTELVELHAAIANLYNQLKSTNTQWQLYAMRKKREADALLAEFEQPGAAMARRVLRTLSAARAAWRASG